MTEEELWTWMMDGNYPPGYPGTPEKPIPKLHRTACATLARDTDVSKWQGHDKPKKHETWPAGKRVKVVMASRFGDVGITDDLKASRGYHCRIQCVEAEFPFGGETRLLKPENLLIDIEPIKDPRE